MRKKKTLVINLGSSYCGDCGLDCDPNEKRHITNLGWDEETRKKKGCGVKYKYVTSDYCSLHDDNNSIATSTKKMRPDLIYYNIWEEDNE